LKLRRADIRQSSYSPPASLLAISLIKLGDIIGLCSFWTDQKCREEYGNAILPTFGCFCFEVGQIATKYFDNDQNENVYNCCVARVSVSCRWRS
jgi:hypothetical protein